MKVNPLSYLKKMVIGEGSDQERLIKSGKLEFLCIDNKGKQIVIKDTLNGNVFRVGLIKYIHNIAGCYCITCKNSKCDHTIFTWYSVEIGALKALSFAFDNIVLCAPEPIRRRLIEKKELCVHMIQQKVLPVALLMLVGSVVIPIFCNSADHQWYTIFSFLNNNFWRSDTV